MPENNYYKSMIMRGYFDHDRLLTADVDKAQRAIFATIPPDMTAAVRSIYAARLNEFPEFAFGGDRAFEHRGAWRSFFRNRMGPTFNGQIVFEIGCSNAGYLSRIASKHPATGFVGLDWKCKAIYDGAKHIAESAQKNIVLLRARAQDILKIFAPSELDEVWLFHPDPCDREVELKNRLVGEPFLHDLHQVLRNDHSILAIKTDHPGYYQWILALFGMPQPDHFTSAAEGNRSSPRVRARDLMFPEDFPKPIASIDRQFEVTMNSFDLWRDDSAINHTASRLFSGEATAFETRFIRKHFPIYYFEIRKRS